jgi:hypothetical protein
MAVDQTLFSIKTLYNYLFFSLWLSGGQHLNLLKFKDTNVTNTTMWLKPLIKDGDSDYCNFKSGFLMDTSCVEFLFLITSKYRITPFVLFTSWLSTQSTLSSCQHHQSWPGSLYDSTDIPKWEDEEDNIIQRDCHLHTWHVKVAGVRMPPLYKTTTRDLEKCISSMSAPTCMLPSVLVSTTPQSITQH